jgi:hypothetical protein
VLTFTKLYSNDIDSSKVCFEKALDKLLLMLDNREQPDFKKAVFISENAYYNDSMDYASFNRQIQFLIVLAKEVISTDSIIYNDKDKDKIKVFGAVFKLMTDTTYKVLDSLMIINKPFTYDFDDIWGIHDWSKMFVTKLLNEGNGNCHSMPFLYKILCHELGVEAYLALAPNHIYIKCHSNKWGWYNTELTSSIFPVDSWLMASGYIHLSAIQNGIYMDTLSLKESIAFCLFDLAKGYERKFGVGDGRFILKCCDSVLKYYPNFINALLLRAETKRKVIFKEMEKHQVKTPQDIFYISGIKTMYDEMETTYTRIHQLGYRQMPEEMYIQWISSLKTNSNLYQNKNILKFEH